MHSSLDTNLPRFHLGARAHVKLAAGRSSPKKTRGWEMRIGLLIVAALALIGFVVVAVVLPQMAGTEAKEAAQALVSGAEAARQQGGAPAEKAGGGSAPRQGVKGAARQR